MKWLQLRWLTRLSLLVFLCFSMGVSVVFAEPSANEKQATPEAAASQPAKRFLRLRCDSKKHPVALEAAIVRFEPAAPGKHSPVVDLVGAVHVAEPGFFAQLNKEFDNYDAVLYELVAVEGTRPTKEMAADAGRNPVSFIQTGMTQMLDLQFQLEGIDYQRKNMIHADMSPEEMSQSMHERGESVGSILMRLFAVSMAQQSKNASGSQDVEMMMAFFNKDRALALKRIMAKQFEDMGGMMQMIDGPKGSTLISQRNKKALKVLDRELKAGKRKVAIFYGAGHMADMAKRLDKDFGLKPTSTRWLVAWDLTDPKAKKAEKNSKNSPLND